MADIATLIINAKSLMPAKFITQVDDTKITAFLNLVLADVNATSPATGYSLDSMPSTWDWIICFGAQMYGSLFLVAQYSLSDFSYNDNGLSLQIDRTAKLTPVYNMALVNFEKMKLNLKKAEAISTGAKALATYQYTSLVQQFMSTIFMGTMQH